MNYFYGNTVNPSQFQFDKIYPNRKTMDDSCQSDEIFIGRYVLVKYDTNIEIGRVYIDSDGYGYTSQQKELVTRIYFKDISEKFYYDYKNDEQLFYVSEEADASGYALFSQINIETQEEEVYFKNLIIDKNAYKIKKTSYDGTVWQKSYIDNVEKYIKVANLNTGVPLLSVGADAPTHWPITPHFEISASEDNKAQQIYRLHIQPQWGFRIGQSDDLSDENILWIREKYDPNEDIIVKEYYNSLGQWQTYQDNENAQLSTIPGAIFYNKAGFKKDKRSYSDILDKISINAVNSGIKYRNHQGAEEEQPDIQEMKILLPSIGNAVSDMWDIIYGKERNLDIDWGSLNGIRMARQIDNYRYDTKEGISTLAGCINSVHDLMGMIIMEQPENAATASNDNIYWDGKTFNRRKKTYDYSRILTKENGDYKFEKVTDIKNNYIPNTYFLDDEGKEPDKEGKYNNSKTYYKRLLQTNYKPTDKMVEYVSKKYYYIDLSNNYMLEDQEYSWDKEKRYYEIIEKGNYITFKTSYFPNQFYYFEDNQWKVEKSDLPNPLITYYKLKIVPQEGIPYKKDGSFFIKNKENNSFIAATGDYDENAVYYQSVIEEDGGKVILTQAKVFGITNSHFQKNDNDDYYQEAFIDGEPYYLISIEEDKNGYIGSDFYISNMYYYKDKNNNYLLGSEKEFLKDVDYFVLIENDYIPMNVDIIPIIFFEPNVYYIDAKDKKILAENYDSNIIYYTLGEDFHISADEKNSFSIGSLWNNQVSLVPWPVVLSRRDTVYVFEELKGFANSYNTLHGLILQLNYLMENNDIHTRDTATLKGSINKLNDIFFKFDALVPDTMLSVGLNGKIYSTDYKADKWIDFKIDNVDHRIFISHKDIVEDNDDLLEITLDISKPIKIKYDKKGHIYSIINN